MKKLETLAAEAFCKCKRRKLYYSPYCIFSNIFIQMNHIEIYYLCSYNNSEDTCCFDTKLLKRNYCKECKRLNEFNLLFTKIAFEKTFKLVFLIDKLIDFLFVYNYYLLSGLKRKKCRLDHMSILNHMNMKKKDIFCKKKKM